MWQTGLYGISWVCDMRQRLAKGNTSFSQPAAGPPLRRNKPFSGEGRFRSALRSASRSRSRWPDLAAGGGLRPPLAWVCMACWLGGGIEKDPRCGGLRSCVGVD